MRISCIMSNYNTNEEYLKLAIESILNQSFIDFEFIIIDDCSTDDSLSIINKYAELDKRIKVVKNSKNMGLAYSLNKGIQLAKGEYIARMDSDDISRPNRFELQVNYLDKNPNIDIIGTFSKSFGDSHNYNFTPFFSSDYCKIYLLFSTCLVHPSVMFRRNFILENKLFYNAEYLYSQDFELWSRAASYGNIEILDKVLLDYRIHSKQVSQDKVQMQQDYAKNICLRQLKNLNIYPNDIEINSHMILGGFEMVNNKNISDLIEWTNKINSKNADYQIYDHQSLKRMLNNRIFNLILKSDMKKLEKAFLLLKNIKLMNYFNIYSIVYRMFFLFKQKGEN